MNRPARQRSRKRDAAKLSFIVALGLLCPRCLRSIPPAFETYQPPRLTGDPPSTPLVRLETGMHTSLITQIATDAGGRWLATSSYDKTARVWDLANGNLLRVLRPPQGDGWEGVLYAVAITPDGERVAVAGAKGSYEEQGGSVYIFDRASGKLVRRIPGSSADVIRLAFSPDGRVLAVAARDCLRLIDPSSRDELAKETFRRVDSYGLHFRYDGKRLVTASLDGTLRLYDVEVATLRKLVEARAPVGNQPYAARFSPDGTRIAVGFNDTSEVVVLNASTLKLAYRPDTRTVRPDNLMAVSWSDDGSSLYAAGRSFAGGKFIVRRWADAGRGEYVDISLADSTIEDLVSLPQGKLAFASQEPSWGVITAEDRILFRRGGAIANFIRLGDGLRLSKDGTRVRFGYQREGRAPATFDIVAERLGTDREDLDPPRTSARGLSIEWRETHQPTLNGNALPVQPKELSRCLAISPDESRFALGTEWHLRLFNRDGELVWRFRAPGPTFAVNISGDGRWVVAAYGDGTIRWHRIDDGGEVLAFFPHADRKRWVAWTPEGFFDASSAADRLVGYHLNRGWDHEGEFVTYDRLVEVYFRPLVIVRRLDPDGDHVIAEMVGKLGDVRKLLPSTTLPRLELVSARNVDDAFKIEVGNPGPEDLWLVWTVDGIEIQGRPLDVRIAAGGTASRQLDLPDGQYLVVTRGLNSRGVGSEPIEVLAERKTKTSQPALYVLAIGISLYSNSALNLKFASSDAKAVAQRFQARATGLFPKGVQVKTIVDSAATKATIEKQLNQMLKSVQPEDTFVLYMAGHGTVVDQTYYFLPHETKDQNDETVRSKGISETTLRGWLAKLPIKSLLLLDTCRAGEAIKPIEDEGAVSRFMHTSNRAIIAAATGKQLALEGYEGHGVFTYVLLNALSRADYDQDGEVATDEIGLYLRNEVPKITEKKWHLRQIPMQDLPGTPFPLSLPEAL